MVAKEKKRPFAAFDLDGTLQRKTMLEVLVRACAELGLFDETAEREYQRLRQERDRRSIDHDKFGWAIVHLFHQHLKGCREEDLLVVAKVVAERNRSRQHVFTAALLQALTPTHECVLITGAVEEVMTYLGPMLGFPNGRCYATKLEKVNGIYTGRQVDSPANDKRSCINGFFKETGVDCLGSVAVGDSGPDIPMLAASQLPIAFNPSPALGEAAEANGWTVVVEVRGRIYVSRGDAHQVFRAELADEAVTHALSPLRKL